MTSLDPSAMVRNMSQAIQKARIILEGVRGISLTEKTRCQHSVELAALMLQAAIDNQTHSERDKQNMLARLMSDPMGKAFTTDMTDQSFRSQNPSRIADQLNYLLNKYRMPNYLSFSQRFFMQIFKYVGRFFPHLTIPLIKQMLRHETSSVILPGEPHALARHIAKRRQENVHVNLNHLGEAILGEEEAHRRLNIYLNDLADPAIECVSIKMSTIYSQINLLAWDHTIEILTARLKVLYKYSQEHFFKDASGKLHPKFVYLDMEEYRDLHITIEAFKRALSDPSLANYSAGLALQGYLPDTFPIQQELTEWALDRVRNGGAPIKIRIVKGANLAMERVEASLRDWPQAPYSTKSDVDANFKRMITYGCHPDHAHAVRLGIGSHNLFDIAYALLLRAENKVEPFVSFEMLEGMADHMRRIVQQLSGDILLYCPAATKEDFQHAIAYLIRRLDENTAPENFLRQLFHLQPNTKEWDSQKKLFLDSCENISAARTGPRRTQNRQITPEKPSTHNSFENEPDTDWTLPQNRLWAQQILSTWKAKSAEDIPRVSLAQEKDIEYALKVASKAFSNWSKTSVQERSQLLAEVAHRLRCARGDLIGSMVLETRKTVPEADIEVSEAIDFAEYYRRNIEELAAITDLKWSPKGIVLVTPPWNFPCSIPAGGILAALAAGNVVLFKPAPEAILVGWQLAQAFWEAGVSKEVLQFITCEDEPIGSQLIQNPAIAAVVLTGGTATAKRMLQLRPSIDLVAETGGKNSIIVTSMADRDLAIKDILHSAFSHAGQKCSACSLLICLPEVYDDKHFFNQLRDAASSLKVGSQWDFATKINPLIRPATDALHRGLTNLENGEEWLLEPKQDKHNPNLWSPGIKLGVQTGSFTHQTELFGPVLGVMRANNLDHAIELANGTPYGLTAGIHSLDDREQEFWVSKIEAGNCYINRTITGAIVRRQPFGGCKESSFGPGAKAGGPNYVMQLMNAQSIALPSEPGHISQEFQELTEFISKDQKPLWEASLNSYSYWWEIFYSQRHDPSQVLGEDNFLFYVPHKQLMLRVNTNDAFIDILRAIVAARICKTNLQVSIEPYLFEDFKILRLPGIQIIRETEEELIKRILDRSTKRVRFLSQPSEQLQKVMAKAGCNRVILPVCANGRIELHNYLREVSLSVSYHRYGNLGLRES